MSRFRFLIALGMGCLSLALTPSAGADVLVLKDGSRVETRGAFEVKGRRVHFQDGQGRLMTLRLDEVDLDRSRAESQPASAEAGAAARPASPPKKKTPVLVLTDRDVAPAEPDGASAANSRIVMYSTSWCGYCRRARGLLDQLGVAYEELDIEKSAAARASHGRLAPTCGVPLIDFGGELVCGFSEERIRSLAAEVAKRQADAAATQDKNGES